MANFPVSEVTCTLDHSIPRPRGCIIQIGVLQEHRIFNLYLLLILTFRGQSQLRYLYSLSFFLFIVIHESIELECLSSSNIFSCFLTW